MSLFMPSGAPAPGWPDLPLTALDRAFAAHLQQAQPASDPRHGLLAALASHQYGRGHACLDLAQLQSQGHRALGWDALAARQLPTDLAAAAPGLPWAAGPASPLVLEGQRLYLRRNWEAEQRIRAALEARLQRDGAAPDGLAAALAQLFPPAAADAPGALPVGAPDWQKLACALATRKPLTLITGGPGTGKTTTVVRLLALLQDQAARQGRTLRVLLAAPTGKAAARLQESVAGALDALPAAFRLPAAPPAQTLHRLLQIRPDAPHLAAPELAADLVIVDEASMIDLDMMARLLDAVPLSASLVLLGDKDQLASVEAGAVMAQLCEGAVAGNYDAAVAAWALAQTGADLGPWRGAGGALAQQTVMLRHSRRFRDDSGIGQWARAVNAGDVEGVRRLWAQAPAHGAQGSHPDAVDRLHAAQASGPLWAGLAVGGWQDWLAQMRALQGQACEDAQALRALRAFARFQVLCALREGPWGVQTLNRQLAAGLGFPTGGWHAGRPVMVTRNDYHLGLMNGDVGLCLAHARGLRVAFADGQGGVRWVLPSRLDAVESVFAMTVHKSQGSEFDHVCLVLPDRPAPVLTRELLYTGITRARSRLTLVAPQPQVLWHAVATRVLRSGGLAWPGAATAD